MKITHGRYYYDFHNLVEHLRREDNSCYICGATKNIKPHHIRKVRESDKRYASKSNVVLLCPFHHNKFHQLYGSGKGVNRHNFDIFVKKEHRHQLNKIRKENEELNMFKQEVNKTIVSAVKSERTALGSSVLRNLAANIGVEIDE